MFVAGMPGCGKSHFGRWLAVTHGYRHIDFEQDQEVLLSQMGAELFQFVDIRNPVPLIERLVQQGRPVVFNWGFPLHCLDIASEIASRILPVWFFTSPTLARKSFMERADVPLGAFEKQMADICQHGFALDAIFGDFKVQTIADDGTKKPCEEILTEIEGF